MEAVCGTALRAGRKAVVSGTLAGAEPAASDRSGSFEGFTGGAETRWQQATPILTALTTLTAPGGQPSCPFPAHLAPIADPQPAIVQTGSAATRPGKSSAAANSRVGTRGREFIPH